MLDQLLNSISSWRGFCRVFTRLSLLSTTLALTMVGGGGVASANTVLLSQNPGNTDSETAVVQRNFLKDGVYLYGQSPQPEQIGQSYMVFEVKQGQVTGAFYMPRSSFDCFTGVPEGNYLSLKIIESYTQETHSYQIGLNNTAVVATTGGQVSENNLVLEGFNRLPNVSENDTRILNQCKADLNSRL
ncbi:hypothetical protein [Planktothrix agardhii]|jgi:hypothetical protein|uniref:Uncharacterized protein n=1 Tax=Planktothrix agardhii TaxID=1160 RepID=A0A1J1JH14_PLAAG|nr:hypothetical protein [Planktothrix agardhii]MBG0745474.1 hypothetical protein [Planktothrix agardhii KL2]MCB8761421.1 hypothetical protein [Planktothrix agardhii 1813]MCB8762812.1 hypothetical protein [Planktothrix agardhii 1809]MCB8776408.1 hypothetical protein [Planktothrix agardhii 1031]MCB8780834.1 hypothetical protein [Planktothrix agardhii 1808]